MIKILNIKNVRAEPMSALLSFCNDRIKSGEGATLVPINPIKVVKARSKPEFQEMIDAADWVFADAWGIKWAAKLLHKLDIEICPGWQTMLALIGQAKKEGQSVYLLGTTDEILDLSHAELLKRYPNLKIAGQHNGFYSDEEATALYEEIAALKPDYIFIAMGEYKQEMVLQALRPLHKRGVYQGVGGSLDLIVGRQPMPPQWIRDNHLEWLFRAIRQPFRLPRFKALPIFAVLVVFTRLFGKKAA